MVIKLTIGFLGSSSQFMKAVPSWFLQLYDRHTFKTLMKQTFMKRSNIHEQKVGLEFRLSCLHSFSHSRREFLPCSVKAMVSCVMGTLFPSARIPWGSVTPVSSAERDPNLLPKWDTGQCVKQPGRRCGSRLFQMVLQPQQVISGSTDRFCPGNGQCIICRLSQVLRCLCGRSADCSYGGI